MAVCLEGELVYICATSPDFPDDQAFLFLHAVSQLFSSEKKRNNNALTINEEYTDGVTQIDGVFVTKKVHKLPCALAKKMVRVLM